MNATEDTTNDYWRKALDEFFKDYTPKFPIYAWCSRLCYLDFLHKNMELGFPRTFEWNSADGILKIDINEHPNKDNTRQIL